MDALTRSRAGPGLLLLTIVLAFASCMPPLPDWGGLSIQIAGPEAKTLVPVIDMTLANFEVSGSGPGGALFSRCTSASLLTIGGLAIGDWTIAVEGKNAAGTIIAHGEAPVRVLTGAMRALSIDLAPITGPGSLALTLHWTATDVNAPSIQALLIPCEGMQIELPFAITSPGKATSSSSGIMNGYYTLVIKLLDNGRLVTCVVDVVHIAKDKTTAGTVTFTDINSGTGSVIPAITPQMADTISVTMSGQKAEEGVGQAMTLAATIPAGTGDVDFIWYLNGIAAGKGPSFTVNQAASPLAAGYYRLDVTAFTTAGGRGGSTNCTLRVFPVRQVTLEWDPTTDPDLAEYKLYVGTATGVYGRWISVGLATSYPVSDLLGGHTYYFAATACNTAGAESAKSNEVVYTAP
jgi:hypothetical protein